jgi:4-amino-4-deoxy-L-arabinose transferase-like glycosyltransferase
MRRSEAEPRPIDDGRRSLWLTLAVFAASAALTGWGLGAGSIWNGDDATYALIAREMREGGDFLHLRLDGAILHQRPPLYPWLLALSTAILGETTFALRLPAMLAAAGTSAVVFRLARRVMGPVSSLAAGLVFPTLALPFFYARTVTSDTTLVFFISLSIHFYMRAREGRPDEVRRITIAGAALGLALMTKQIVGLLPLVAPLAEVIARGRDGLPTRRQAVTCATAALIVAGPWHAAMLASDGRAFLEGYLGFNVIERATSSVLYESDASFYLVTLWRKETALVLLAAVGLVLLAVRAVRRREPGAILYVLWPVLVVGAFSIASTRLAYYLLPAYPAIAILLLVPVDRLASRHAKLAAAAAAAVIAASAIAHVPQRIGVVDTSGELRFLSEIVRDRAAEGDTLYVIDDLHLAPRFYSGRRTIGVVTRRPNYERMLTMELFREPGTLRHVPPEAIPSTFADLPRWWVIEPKLQAVRHAPPPGARLVAESPKYVLYSNTRY